jgi:hypothetical protein
MSWQLLLLLLRAAPMALPEASKPAKDQVDAILGIRDTTLYSEADKYIGVGPWLLIAVVSELSRAIKRGIL